MEKTNLTKLGLTQGESRVYLSLLKLGSSTVGPIVKESKIAYSNIYEVLDRLTKKGLVSFIKKEKIKHFSALAPTRIEEYLQNKEQEIENQKQELKKIIPQLISLMTSQEQKIEAEIFLGTKGLKTAYERLLKNTTKEDEALFFYIHEEKYAEKSDDFYNSIYEISKSLKTRGLTNKEYKKSWFVKKAKHFQMKFVDFPIPGNIDIVKDSIMITTWTPEPTGILINSKSIATSFTIYFNKIWKIAK